MPTSRKCKKNNHTSLESSTQAPQTTDEEELQRARLTYTNGICDSYQYYLTPELSNQLDKHKRRMIAYPCRFRPTSDSSCSNLNKHVAGCLRKQNNSKKTHTLASLGIKGTGEINPKEVPQLCAVWCAEAARPFSALVDESHQAILHPTIVKHLPTRKAVKKDIHMLYSAIQESYKAILNAHKGALYLGVDVWQSPNGFDILGVVIYRLEELVSGKSKLEAMPLDFVRLSQRHTGEYLAETVRLVVEKFGIQQKICGIVSDNASNNEVMVRELKKQKWERFKGEGQWKKKKTPNTESTSAQDGSSGSDSGTDDAADQIRPFDCKRDTGSEDGESSSSGLDASDNAEDPESLDLEDIEQASDEDEGSFRAIAKKLWYSPNSKTKFMDICCKKGCSTPHTVKRDVCTRWNSTYIQLRSIIRCKDAILEWQRHKRHGVVRKYYLDQSDFDLAQDLAAVLNLFYEITLQVSISGSPRLSNTVVFIDQITEHLSSAISSPSYPPALRNACRLGLKITNKYYSLTDSSPLYRIAIILHPSFRDEYFKLAQWEPEWISEAIRLAREMWVSFYKPKPVESTPSSSSSNTRPKTSMLAGLGSAAAARGGILSSDPLDIWLAGGLILTATTGEPTEVVVPAKAFWKHSRGLGAHGTGCFELSR
ncbi:hypothetical protein PSTT_02431 [Puccinia striiformis]|uniref:DUF659 domain-containing protein n=1 Tax=Puccinia striiformis TaxID=27350 RepID=A0A2S4W020_9BASI|nr:hypothetical protein PSTT_02431 [Puccinia striiformis]